MSDELRDVPVQGGPGSTASHLISNSLTKNIPDKGYNFVETRLLILDHGRESYNDAGWRNPEWVDFTEFGGIYRLSNVPAIINIGTEGVKPFRFKASTISIKLDNSDFAWDNLKRIALKTVDGNDAKFMPTFRNTNLDLQFRPAKLVTKFPKEEMTVAYDLGYFTVNGITTDSEGSASIKLDSLEKEFMDNKASSVKNGRDWYFDRSVKFLAEELVKSVRREYLEGKETIVGSDIISLSNSETNDKSRIASEFGRPITTVLPDSSGLSQGEKRLIVTAATPRNIFKSQLQSNVSSGSNFIRIRMDTAITIEKGDVLTLGKTTASYLDGLNEEKVTVLETVTFSNTTIFAGTPGEIKNIKVSSLKKNHNLGEEVERWIIYLGCTRGIEDSKECYIIAFDPDRDEYANITEQTIGVFSNPPRFMSLKQDIRTYGAPGPDSRDGIGRGQRLLMLSSVSSFPGRPNEKGSVHIYEIDHTKRWNSKAQLIVKKEDAILPANGGIYTGQMSFRSLKPLSAEQYLGTESSILSQENNIAAYGALGLGKLVDEVIDNFGVRHLGFGYMAALRDDIGIGTGEYFKIRVYAKSNGSESWDVQNIVNYAGDPISSGIIYLIGSDENTDGYAEGIGESFYHEPILFSGKILEAAGGGWSNSIKNTIQYTVAGTLPSVLRKNNTVAIIIPDNGKMYVKNLGENTIINEAQNINIAEFTGNGNTVAIDSDNSLPVIYNNKVKHFKKSSIDRAKTNIIEERDKIDNVSIEPGYYSSILEKRKFEVDKGDVISEDNDLNNSSSNIKIIPAQYTAVPFANELFKIDFSETPMTNYVSDIQYIKGLSDFTNGSDDIIGDFPPLISGDENGNNIGNHPALEAMFEDADETPKNRNIHVWNFPIVGLWCKYKELNKTLSSFDGSIIADNGNAELLGYWYLDYNTDIVTEDTIPLIQVAYTDANGIVKVDNMDNIPADHFPLGVVLHNITNHNGGPGTKTFDFYGNISDVMQERLKKILGGSFEVVNSYEDGSPIEYGKIINSSDGRFPNRVSGINVRYLRWCEGLTQFNKFPLDMNVGTYPIATSIVLKFKKIRDPQAKGTLFTGVHCYPVKIRHFHLPFDTINFDGEINKQPEDNSNSKVVIPSNKTYSYNAKVIDSNFELGSEEFLNKAVTDTKTNLWVLDRYSQSKTFGYVSGVGTNINDQGILKNASIKSIGDDNTKKIEIPVGYRAEASSPPEIRYGMNNTTHSILSVVVITTEVIRFKLSSAHDFTNDEIGSLVKIDGYIKTTGLAYGQYDKTIDGVYRISSVPSFDDIVVEKARMNLPTFYDIYWNVEELNNWTLGTIKRYYGIRSDDLNYSNSDTITIYGQTEVVWQETVNPNIFLRYIGTTSVYSFGDEGRLTVVEENPSGSILFAWNGSGDVPEIGSAAYKLNKSSGSGPAVLSFSSIAYSSLEIDYPIFFSKHIDHKDYLYGTPAGNETYPNEVENTFLSYHKTLFTVPATSSNEIANYPRALSGRSWGKFWNYPERRDIAEFKSNVKYPIGSIKLNGNNDTLTIGWFKIKLKAKGIPSYEIVYPICFWEKIIQDIVDKVNNETPFYTATAVVERASPAVTSIVFSTLLDYSSAKKREKVINMEIFDSTQCRVTFKSSMQNIFEDNDILYFSYERLKDELNALTKTANNVFFKINYFEHANQVIGTFYFDEACNHPTGFGNVDILDVTANDLMATKDYNIVLETDAWMIYEGIDELFVYQSMHQNMHVLQMTGSSKGANIGIASDNLYGEGSGVFNSEIKPLNFTDKFINSMPKWYLSRKDDDDIIQCDTYTLNHDTPFLGNDDNLYSIVNRHPGKPSTITRYPFLKFSLDCQSNVAASYDNKKLYFTKALYEITSNQMQIKTQLVKYDETAGVQVFSNGIPTESSIDIGYYVYPDLEIHGILVPYSNDDNVQFGAIIWRNKGNTELNSLIEGLEGYSYYNYLPDHKFFSDNIMMHTTNNGYNYAAKQFLEPGEPSLVNVYRSIGEKYWILNGSILERTTTLLPLSLKYGSATYTKVSSPPSSGEWSASYRNATRDWLIEVGESTYPSALGISFGYADPTQKFANQFKSINYDGEGRIAYLSLIKAWIDPDGYNYTINSQSLAATRGIIMKRHELLSSVKEEREKREDLVVFHLSAYSGSDVWFMNRSDIMYPSSLTAISKLSFRASGEDGYYFTNNIENNLVKWNGESKEYSPSVVDLNGGLPVVEGDFNQYCPIIKIGNAYEEIFGFSMGTKGHLAAQAFKGGRNIIWKLSESIAFHIAVADFDGLSVWDALENFAELTDSVIGFDRLGNFHFESRPYVDSDTAFFHTFDEIENNNIISITKNPPYQHLYNEIEVVPFKPVLPNVNVSLTTQSDLNIVTVNHDLFIKDKVFDYSEKSPNKARPNISAFQKDFKRKKILLICTNGQFNSKDAEARGLYSRFKYQLVEDIIELRLTVSAEKDATELYLNKIPFDDVNNILSIKEGDIAYIGETKLTISAVDLENNMITVSSIGSQRFQSGTSVLIVSVEQDEKEYFAEGSGNFPIEVDEVGGDEVVKGYTYSPKTFFVEIGEWTFDDIESKNKSTILTADIGPGKEYVPVKDISIFPNKGIISVAGTLISYNGKSGTNLIVVRSVETDLSAGLKIHLMPPAPIVGGTISETYNPTDLRIGGYDELGPSCLDEYHLLDPNEDGYPYYDDSVEKGGRPITALEFYGKDQIDISYIDKKTRPGSGEISNIGHKRRHRTYTSMKIDFNGFRFNDGDKIELDIPGIKLEKQEHLKKTYSISSSIQRNGLRQYPATNNRFFNNTTAVLFGKKILNRITRIGMDVTLEGYINDINDLDWLKTVKIKSNRMFGGYTDDQVIGYINSIKFNQDTGIATINILTQES